MRPLIHANTATTSNYLPTMPRILAQLCAILLLLLLLPACQEKRKKQGLHWQAPSYESLPSAFDQGDASIPNYAQQWRAPESFAHFPELWNKRVKLWLSAEIAQLDERKDARQIKIMQARQSMGDYLVFAQREDIPSTLRWEDGMDEPELGSPRAKKGGHMRIPFTRAYPNTLRPFGAGSSNGTRRYIYDDINLGLVRMHPLKGNIIPGVATKWALSKDGATVYYEIDKQARFSDGEPVNTQAIISALLVRSSPYSIEAQYSNYYLQNIARITIYSDHILSVTLPSPRPYAAYYAAVPLESTAFYAEFGPDYLQRYQWRVAPTTGGYKLDPAGFVKGRTMRLKRIEDWWARDRKYTRYSCNPDSISYHFINEPSKTRELFCIRQLDVLPTRDMRDWYEGLELDALHRGYIQRVQFNNIWPRNSFGFHLNCSKAPFDDINMRLGLHHAMHIQRVIESVFRSDFNQLGSFFSGFGELSNERIKAREYSPRLARQYFAKAGYHIEGEDGILQKSDGTRLQISISSRIDPLYNSCMSILRDEAAACGVELLHESMDDSILFAKVRDKEVEASIFSWGFYPPLPQPDAYYHSQYAYAEDGRIVKSSNNISAYACPDLDRATEASSQARTLAEAITTHHRVQQLIHDGASWIPGWSSVYWRFAQWRWVKWPENESETPFCPPRYSNPLDSYLYWIDEEEKEQCERDRAAGKSLPEQEIYIPVPNHKP